MDLAQDLISEVLQHRGFESHNAVRYSGHRTQIVMYRLRIEDRALRIAVPPRGMHLSMATDTECNQVFF